MRPSWNSRYYFADREGYSALVVEPLSVDFRTNLGVRYNENRILARRYLTTADQKQDLIQAQIAFTMPMAIDMVYPLLMSHFQSATWYNLATADHLQTGTLELVAPSYFATMGHVEDTGDYGNIHNGCGTGSKIYTFFAGIDNGYRIGYGNAIDILRGVLANEITIDARGGEYLQLVANCLVSHATRLDSYSFTSPFHHIATTFLVSDATITLVKAGATLTNYDFLSFNVRSNAGFALNRFVNRGTFVVMPTSPVQVTGEFSGDWVKEAGLYGTFTLNFRLNQGNAWFEVHLPYCITDELDLSQRGADTAPSVVRFRAVGQGCVGPMYVRICSTAVRVGYEYPAGTGEPPV